MDAKAMYKHLHEFMEVFGELPHFICIGHDDVHELCKDKEARYALTFDGQGRQFAEIPIFCVPKNHFVGMGLMCNYLPDFKISPARCMYCAWKHIQPAEEFELP